MVVLNILGKIKPICISKKLKIYISNLPNEKNNNWNEDLVNEMRNVANRKNSILSSSGNKGNFSVKEIACKALPDLSTNITEEDAYQIIADNMICLYFDFPVDDWETNPFVSRACEEDYSEKFINFLSFVNSKKTNIFQKYTPIWIYSPFKLFEEPHRIFSFLSSSLTSVSINALKNWGKLLDTFLQDKNDYFLLDYLINSIHADNKYNVYHYFKSYSLCQLFLEKDKESELDEKLPLFLDSELSPEKRKEIASLLRKMRNKIAHGDFIAFEAIAEEYAQKVMDGNYWFDYAEYSRKNWILLHSCCMLDDAIRRMIAMLFTDKTKLTKIKTSKS